MSPSDLAVALAVLAAAGWLLVRTIRRGGACAGCSGARGCARERERGAPLVSLVRRDRPRGHR